MQVEQYTKSYQEVHGSVPFSHRLSVKRGRQYIYSTTIFPLKTHISEKTKSTDTNQRCWGTVWLYSYMHLFTFENYLFRRHIAIQSCNRSNEASYNRVPIDNIYPVNESRFKLSYSVRRSSSPRKRWRRRGHHRKKPMHNDLRFFFLLLFWSPIFCYCLLSFPLLFFSTFVCIFPARLFELRLFGLTRLHYQENVVKWTFWRRKIYDFGGF